MQIGVIGTPDHWYARFVGNALRRMGHDVTELGAARPWGRGWFFTNTSSAIRHRFPHLDVLLQSRIANRAIESGCQVVLNLDYNLAPDVVARLRKHGARVACWFHDSLATLNHRVMLSPYNAIFFKEPYLVDRLRLLDAPVYYLPQACDSTVHRPLCESATEPYFVVVGDMYPARILLLERLIDRDIPLRIYGRTLPDWMGPRSVQKVHTGRYLDEEEKARVFRSATGVINNINPADIHGVAKRLFEAAGSGGAVITEFRRTVPDLFDVGSEILVYNDFEELVSHTKTLLADRDLAQKLGDAASRRAHREHTYEARMAEILSILT